MERRVEGTSVCRSYRPTAPRMMHVDLLLRMLLLRMLLLRMLLLRMLLLRMLPVKR